MSSDNDERSLHRPMMNVGLQTRITSFLDRKGIHVMAAVNKSANDAVMNYSDDTWRRLITQSAVNRAGHCRNVTLLKKAVELRLPVNHVDALMFLYLYGDIGSVLSIFDAGLDVNTVNSDGFSIPLFATEQGDIGTLTELMNRGDIINFQPTTAEGDTFYTLLQWACTKAENKRGSSVDQKFPVVEFLLTNRANPNVRNNHISALMIAVMHNCIPLMKLLLDAGADPNEVSSYTGCGRPLPLMLYAKTKRYDEAAELLVKYGADPNPRRP